MSKLDRLANNKLAMLGVLVLVLIGGFLLYRQYDIRQEKQRFEQARASIDALYAEIVAIAGEPDKTESSESCGYAERKFDRGSRSCGVSTDFVYGVRNKEQGTELFRKIKTAMIKRSDVFTITFSNDEEVTPFVELKDEQDEKEIGISLTSNLTPLNCSSRLVYAHKDNDSHYLNTASKPQAISGYVSCIGEAKAEHYPVKNY